MNRSRSLVRIREEAVDSSEDLWGLSAKVSAEPIFYVSPPFLASVQHCIFTSIFRESAFFTVNNMYACRQFSYNTVRKY